MPMDIIIRNVLNVLTDDCQSRFCLPKARECHPFGYRQNIVRTPILQYRIPNNNLQLPIFNIAKPLSAYNYKLK